MRYDPSTIEPKWQKIWDERRAFQTPTDLVTLKKRPKFYVLDMFPYPSGAGLHVGHPLGYIGTDVYARFMRMQRHNVLHAMGYDAFGLPAEQYAVQTGQHPRITTEANIANMRRQLRALGLGHDRRRRRGGFRHRRDRGDRRRGWRLGVLGDIPDAQPPGARKQHQDQADPERDPMPAHGAPRALPPPPPPPHRKPPGTACRTPRAHANFSVSAGSAMILSGQSTCYNQYRR